jgi:prolipoprotein diacylglyceryltransferase
MLPVNIDFWIFHFRGYEGHWAVSILIMGYFYQRYRSLKNGFLGDWFDKAWAISILTGFVFARLFHFLIWERENFFLNPISIFTAQGGFAIFGGTIGTALGAFIYCKYTKVDFLKWCDSLMIPLTLGLAISRMSCFLNGDAYGIPTSSILGVVFSEDSDAWMQEWKNLHQFYKNSEDPLGIISQIFFKYVNLSDIPIPNSHSHLNSLGYKNLSELTVLYPPTAIGNYKEKLVELNLIPFPVVYPKVHPTQVYEIFIMTIIFFILKKLDRKSSSKERMFFYFWILYGINRIIIETLRGDRSIFIYNITYSQLISIGIILFSVLILIYSKRTSSEN